MFFKTNLLRCFTISNWLEFLYYPDLLLDTIFKRPQHKLPFRELICHSNLPILTPVYGNNHSTDMFFGIFFVFLVIWSRDPIVEAKRESRTIANRVYLIGRIYRVYEQQSLSAVRKRVYRPEITTGQDLQIRQRLRTYMGITSIREAYAIEAAHTALINVSLGCFIKRILVLGDNGVIRELKDQFYVDVCLPKEGESKEIVPEPNVLVSVQWLSALGQGILLSTEPKRYLATDDTVFRPVSDLIATGTDFCFIV